MLQLEHALEQFFTSGCEDLGQDMPLTLRIDGWRTRTLIGLNGGLVQNYLLALRSVMMPSWAGRLGLV